MGKSGSKSCGARERRPAARETVSCNARKRAHESQHARVAAGKGKGDFQIHSIGEPLGAGKAVQERAETLSEAKTRAQSLAKKKKLTVVVLEPGNGTPVAHYGPDGKQDKDEDYGDGLTYSGKNFKGR